MVVLNSSIYPSITPPLPAASYQFCCTLCFISTATVIIYSRLLGLHCVSMTQRMLRSHSHFQFDNAPRDALTTLFASELPMEVAASGSWVNATTLNL